MILTKKSKRILAVLLTGAVLLSTIPLHTLGAESDQKEQPPSEEVPNASESAVVNYVSFSVGEDQKDTVAKVYALKDETVTGLSDYDATDGQFYLSEDMTAQYCQMLTDQAAAAKNQIYLSDKVGLGVNAVKLILTKDGSKNIYILKKSQVLSADSAVKAVFQLDETKGYDPAAVSRELKEADTAVLKTGDDSVNLTVSNSSLPESETAYVTLDLVKTGEGEEAVYSFESSAAPNQLLFPIKGTLPESRSAQFVYDAAEGWKMKKVDGVTLTVTSSYSQFYQNREVKAEVTNSPVDLLGAQAEQKVVYGFQADDQKELLTKLTSYDVPDGCSALKVRAKVEITNKEDASIKAITLRPELTINSLQSSNPVVVGCKVTAVGDNVLNLLSFGLFSNDKVRIAIDIETPLSDSFDKVMINDEAAKEEAVSGTLRTYSVEVDPSAIAYDKEGIKVKLLKGKSDTLVNETSIETVEKQSGGKSSVTEMDSSYFVIVNHFLPVIQVNGDETDEVYEAGVVTKLSLPMEIVSDTVESSEQHNSGLKKVAAKLYKDAAKTENLLVTFTSDGETVKTEGDDSLSAGFSIDGEASGFSKGIVEKQKYLFGVNGDPALTALEDGDYYLRVTVTNNCGNPQTRLIHFVVDRSKPTVQYYVRDDGQKNCVSDGVEYYDQKAVVCAEITDAALTEELLNEHGRDYFIASVKRHDNRTGKDTTLSKAFADWKMTGKNTFVGTLTLDEEGLYTIETIRLKDPLGNAVKDAAEKPVKIIGVDHNDPQIKVEYTGNLKKAYLRSFGIYQTDEITANFTVSDFYSGVDPDSIHLYNAAKDDAELPITKTVNADKTVTFSYKQVNNKTYDFRVTAKDAIGRDEPENTVKITPSYLSGDGMEIVQTNHLPEISLPVSVPEMTAEDFNVDFTVNSSKSNAAADSGLDSAEVRVYYSSAATKEAAETDFADTAIKPAAVLRDLGKELTSSKPDQFSLSRKEHTDTDYHEEKVSSCEYALNVKAASGSLKTGYYRVVVKAFNNTYDNGTSKKLYAEKSFDFSVSTERPRLGYKVEGTFCTADGMKIYDGTATVTATVRSRVLNEELLNNGDVFRYTITNTTSGKNDYTFGEWKADTEPNTYRASAVLTDEGRYTLSGFGVTDSNGFEAEKPEDRSFAVDCTEPSIHIAYEGNALDQYLQPFGIYRSDEIKAIVTVTDTYAGVDPKSVSIVNTAVKDSADQPANVTSRFASEESADGKTVVYTYSLKTNVLFTLSASAKDRLKRTADPENEITYEIPDAFKMEFGIPDEDNEPTAHFIQVLPKLTKDDFTTEFRAFANNDTRAVNPGLNSVKAEIYFTNAETRADAETAFADLSGMEAIATLTDDGKTDTVTDGAFTLERAEHQGEAFDGTAKITDCKYSLSVAVNDSDRENRLASGYYLVVLTVTNNELNPDKTYTSASKSGIFGIDTDAPVLSYSYDGISVSGDDKPVYDNTVTITAALTDRDLTAYELNNNSHFDITLENTTAGKTYSFGKWKTSSEKPNTYYATVTLQKEGNYQLVTNSVTDSFGHPADAKETEFFAIDCTEPKVKVSYSTNVTNTLLNVLTFGLFRSDDVTVTIDVTDAYAGIDKDNLLIQNGEAVLNDLFAVTDEEVYESSETGEKVTHHQIYTAVLGKETEYRISVSANDRFCREGSHSLPKYVPSSAETSTIVVTDDTPNIKNVEAPVVEQTNQDFVYRFRASSQIEKEGTDPGLHSVNVKVYYSAAENEEEAKKDFEDLSDNTLAANITDNGEGAINNTSKYFTLSRTDHDGINYREEKVSSCVYQLSVSVFGDRPAVKMDSGYYYVLVTAWNNVLDENGKHKSFQKEYGFSVASDKPNLDYSMDEALITSDGVPVYDQQTVIRATIYDRTLNLKKIKSGEYFDYQILTRDGEETAYRFGDWKEIGDNLYEGTVTVDQEGFYTLKTNKLINGNHYETTYKNLSFAVDQNEPAVKVTYTDNVTSDLMNYLTFGLFRNDDIKATIEIQDDVAGIDMNRLKITNDSMTISKETYGDLFNVVADETYKSIIHHHLVYEVTLKKEQAYTISVEANDRLRRADSKSRPEYLPEETETGTIVVTEDMPAAKNVKNTAGELTSDPFVYQFRAKSQEHTNGTDPGLNSVNVKVYYSDAKTEAAAQEAFSNPASCEVVADITDNGSEFENNTNENIRLSRVDYADVNFRNEKVSNCVYQLDVAPVFTGETAAVLDSGYYYIVVTVYNNVLDAEGNYQSAQTTSGFSIDTDKPSVTYTIADSDIQADGVPVYDQEVTITATVIDRTLNLNKIKDSQYFSYVFQTREGVDSGYRFKNWHQEGDNTYAASVTIKKEDFYCLKTNYLKDRNGYQMEDKEDLVFAIDRKEPTVKVSYSENVTRKLLNTLTFGLFRSDDITAVIDIQDDVAGIDMDALQIFTGEEQITAESYGDDFKVLTDDYNDENGLTVHHHVVYEVKLQREKEYTINVLANDRMKRNDSHSEVKYNPKDTETQTIVVTDDVPAINVSEESSVLPVLTNEPFEYKFTAVSDADGTGTDAGLNKVNVKVYYSGAETEDKAQEDFADLSTLESKADITDREDTIHGNISKYFRLSREENESANYKQEEVTSCRYKLSINPAYNNSSKYKLDSGYYRIVVTVWNNVLDENGEYHSVSSTADFSINTDAPVLTYTLEEASVTADGVPVYDQSTTITAKVYDRSFTEEILNSEEDNPFQYKILTHNGKLTDYRFQNWKAVEGEPNTYITSVTVDDEGFYTLKTNSLKHVNDSNADKYRTKEYKLIGHDGQETEHKLTESFGFGVDDNEPSIQVEYKENVIGSLLSYLTFGIYRTQDIDVTITVTDPIAGIDESKFKVKNGGEEDITGSANPTITRIPSESDKTLHKLIYQFRLNRDEAYVIKAEAKDRMNRADSEWSITYPDGVLTDNGEPKEIIVTNEIPNIDYLGQFKNNEPLNTFTNHDGIPWTNQSHEMRFSVQDVLKGDHPGLHSVEVSIYSDTESSNYGDAEACFADLSGKSPIATLTDDGKDVSSDNEIFVLKRDNDQEADFSKEKITSCVYTLSVNGAELPSGYYHVVVTAKNNVLDDSDQYLKRVFSTDIGIDVDQPTVEYTFETITDEGSTGNTAAADNGVAVYDRKVKITATVKDRTMADSNGNLLLNEEEYYQSTITNRNAESSNPFTVREEGWQKTEDNTYVSTIVIDENDPDFKNTLENFYTLTTNTLKDGVGNTGSADDVKFGIDCNEPTIKVTYNGSTINTFFSFVTFGIYRDYPIEVQVTIDDPIAGFENDYLAETGTAAELLCHAVVIQNRHGDTANAGVLSNEEVTFKADKNFVKDDGTMAYHNGTYTFSLTAEQYYDICVTAHDRLERGTYTQAVPLDDYDESTRPSEIVYTKDDPSIKELKISNSDYKDKDKILWYNNQSFNLTFTANDDNGDPKDQGVHSGLKMVKVEIYNSDKTNLTDAKGEFTKNPYVTLVDEKAVSTVTEKGFTLARVTEDAANKDYHTEKAESCQYQITVDPAKIKTTGYYYAVITVENNVPMGNDRQKAHSCQQDMIFGIDHETPVIEIAFTDQDGKPDSKSNTVNKYDYYDHHRKATITVTDRALDMTLLNEESDAIIKYQIQSEKPDHKYSLKNQWKAVKGKDNTYQAEILLKDGYVDFKLNYIKDALGNRSEKDKNQKSMKYGFAIDTAAPNVKLEFMDKNNKKLDESVKGKTYDGNDYTYYQLNEVYVKITVKDYTFDPSVNVENEKYNFLRYTTIDLGGVKKEETIKNNDTQKLTWTSTDQVTWETTFKLDKARYESVRFVAEDKAANKSVKDEKGKLYKQKFVVENDSPSKPSISLPKETDNITPKGVNNVPEVSFKAYGSTIGVTVTARDSIAGVRKVDVLVHNYLTGKNDTSHTMTYSESKGKQTISFEIKAEFTGYIEVQVTDFCGNTYKEVKKNELKEYVMVDSTNPTLDRVRPEVEFEMSEQDMNKIYGSDVVMKVKITDPTTNSKGNVACAGLAQTYEVTVTGPAGENARTWTMTMKSNNEFFNSYQGTFTVPKEYNYNKVKVTVKASDKVKNSAEASTTVNIDTTKPAIAVNYDPSDPSGTDSEKQYFKANRSAEITITERNLNTDDVTIKVTRNGSEYTNYTAAEWIHQNPSSPTVDTVTDNTTHKRTLTFADDGDYVLTVKCKDQAGNESDEYNDSNGKFTIDKTLPKINDVNVTPGAYYKENTTINFSIEEHNFDSSQTTATIKYTAPGAEKSVDDAKLSGSDWSSGNDTHTASYTITKTGAYTIEITCKDKAENEASKKTIGTFYLDKDDPKISFEVVTRNEGDDKDKSDTNPNGKASRADKVYFKFSFSDYSYESYNVDVTRYGEGGKDPDFNLSFSQQDDGYEHYFEAPDNIEQDGIYQIDVTVKDKANNDDSASLVYSVNRNGSTYRADDETQMLLEKGSTNKPQNIVIEEINVDKITTDVNSIKVTRNNSDTLILVDGNGKVNEKYLDINEDENKETNSKWNKVTYTFMADLFKQEGTYEIRIGSTDEKLDTKVAGQTGHYVNNNTQMNRDNSEIKLNISFAIDKTAPKIILDGIKNQYYSENSKTLLIDCEDTDIYQLAKDSIDDPKDTAAWEELNNAFKIIVSGVPYSYTRDQLEPQKDMKTVRVKIEFTSAQYPDEINVSVEATDKAGNKMEPSEDNQNLQVKFKLTANFIEILYNNYTVLFFGIIIGLMLIIAAIIIVIVRKKKKKA